MCEACWVDEYGRPTDLPENGDEIADLIRTLYVTEETGGPLHVQIDDFNVEGHWRPYQHKAKEDQYPPETLELAQRICDRMNPLTLSQRAAVVARFEGWF